MAQARPKQHEHSQKAHERDAHDHEPSHEHSHAFDGDCGHVVGDERETVDKVEAKRPSLVSVPSPKAETAKRSSHSHAHGHSHGHSHKHGPGHSHHHGSTGRAFAIGVFINSAFVLIELAAGFASHSLALVADAAHNLGDVAGLALAWGATRLAKRKPSSRRTYGLRRSTILASLANAILILVGVGAVAWEAIGRLRSVSEVQPGIVIGIAAAGVVVNGGSALLFLAGRKQDANVRGAFMHLAADAAVSLGVVVAGVLMMFTRWMWLDPVMSLIVSLVILMSTWSLVRESLDLALDAVPEGIDPARVKRYLAELDGVREVHDLHIWAMSTTETALTAHLVMVGDATPTFHKNVARVLAERFDIGHSTLQVEHPDCPEPCTQGSADAL